MLTPHIDDGDEVPNHISSATLESNLTQLFIFPSLLRMFLFELDAPRISVKLIRKMESVVLLKWLSYILSKQLDILHTYILMMIQSSTQGNGQFQY